MSQAKVDKYKEEKKNREKIVKKEKRTRLIWTLVGVAVVAVVAVVIILAIINAAV